MRLVLVNPPPRRRTELYDRPNYPPLSLAYLAGATLAAGITTTVVDAKVHRLDLEQTIDQVKAERPDAIGLTAMTHEINRTADVAKALKTVLPEVMIIVGGIHTTFLARETLSDFPAFDYAVAGEGEIVLPQLLEAKDPTGIPGLAWRKNGKIFFNQPAAPLDNLDELPQPAWQLWPRMPVYHLITARGCPYHCIFCAQAHGHRVREHSPERIADDFARIVNDFHPERVYFVDETFGFNRERADAILALFRERKLGEQVPWWAGTRADCSDAKLFREMKTAGCFLVQLGIESGSNEVLKRIGKGITKDKVRAAVNAAREAKLKVEGLFIIGHPHETPSQVNETLAFIRELNPDHLALGLMVPYPGTELAAMIARGEGGYRLLSQNWNDYNKQLGKALELEGYSRRQMEFAQLRGYLGLYLRHGRILDFLRFAWANWRGALAFIRNFISGREVPDWYPAGRSSDHMPQH